MKSSATIILFWIILCVGSGGVIFSAAQGQEQERIVEKVEVTNIEVPVRVLYKGKPVTGLSKDDFLLYENKKRVEINGFIVKRKSLDVVANRSELSPGEVGQLKPRAFVMVFSITDFNENIQKAVDHLFHNVLRPNDRLMIFANDKTITHPDIKNGQTIKQQLIAELKNEGIAARRRLINYINKVETELNINDFRIQFARRDQRPRRLINFLKKYLLTWNDYKKKYLTPKIDRFYYFSRYLENMPTEKWVLNFYQFDLFPKIRLGSDTMEKIRDLSTRLITNPSAGPHAMGKMIHNLLNQITIDLNVSKGVPIDAITKLFHKVDATFHSFFIRSSSKIGFNDFEYEEVASDIENTLKSITRVTGGKNITSNNLVKSIETVSKLKDEYYILTYVPANPKKAGKLTIKTKNKKQKVYYDNNFRADYISEYLNKLEKQIKIPEIKIMDFSFENKILAFSIVEYLMKDMEKEKGRRGRIQIRIRVTDKENNPLFDQSKMLSAQKNDLKISLAMFKRIKTGEYNFLLDAVDLYTGRKTNYYQNVIVE
jgi:hypothetical protein